MCGDLAWVPVELIVVDDRVHPIHVVSRTVVPSDPKVVSNMVVVVVVSIDESGAVREVGDGNRRVIYEAVAGPVIVVDVADEHVPFIVAVSGRPGPGGAYPSEVVLGTHRIVCEETVLTWGVSPRHWAPPTIAVTVVPIRRIVVDPIQIGAVSVIERLRNEIGAVTPVRVVVNVYTVI